MSSLISQNAFQVIDSRPVTSSRIVANYFGKRHEDVVRSIRSIISKKPELQASRNFAEWSEEVEIGSGAKRTVVCYWMDRKGFSILAMGFTGAKALDFKCAFYDEFERMEKQLHPQCPAQTQLPAPTLTEQQAYAIMSKVAIRAKRDGAKYQTIYRALKARYQVTKYTNIPRDKFDDAVKFICTVDLRTPEVPEPEPKQEPETNHGVLVPREFCEALRMRVYYERYVFGEYYERFYRFLQLVDSPLAGRFHEIRTSINLISLERQLAKVGFPVDDILNFKRTPRPNAIVAQ